MLVDDVNAKMKSSSIILSDVALSTREQQNKKQNVMKKRELEKSNKQQRFSFDHKRRSSELIKYRKFDSLCFLLTTSLHEESLWIAQQILLLRNKRKRERAKNDVKKVRGCSKKNSFPTSICTRCFTLAFASSRGTGLCRLNLRDLKVSTWSPEQLLEVVLKFKWLHWMKSGLVFAQWNRDRHKMAWRTNWFTNRAHGILISI